MSILYSLAIDLGAESGRIMLGAWSDQRLTLTEVYRFAHSSLPGADLRHNLQQIRDEITVGLKKAAALGREIASISTDSWGVDYVLLDEANEPLDAPFQYRDTRTHKIFQRMQEDQTLRELLYAETGIQAMNINTAYQLMADAEQRPEVFRRARTFLPIADYINFWLSGQARVETSLASTTQLYNPRGRHWSTALPERLGLPKAIFPPLCPAGTILGRLIGPLAVEPAFEHTQIIATCSHDTGAAVAAVPAQGDDWAYLSSGTWSLLGVERPEPVINALSQKLNFTNELGYGNSVRLLKNLPGLWILQECRRAWAAAGKTYSYQDLVQLGALQQENQTPLIDCTWAEFSTPGDMLQKVHAFCAATAQTPPESVGQVVRTLLESLALLYAKTLQELELLTQTKIARIHIVGGGSQNDLLNQLAADVTQRQIIAGPIEATALGNLLIQATSLGALSGLVEIRQAVRNSFPTRSFNPEVSPRRELIERFERVCRSSPSV